MQDTVVLLVDDEADFVEIMVKRLGKRGFEMLSAMSGPEALEILESTDKVDIVLLDVKMPGMDGISVLRKIRERWSRVEVVMLTGHATVDSAVEGLKLGAFDYLMKPCDIDVLMKKLDTAHERRKVAVEHELDKRAEDIALHRGD